MSTVLYASATDANILSRGFFAFEQLPTTPLYVDVAALTSGVSLDNLPDLYFLDNLLTAAPAVVNGTALDTNGLAFNGAPGYSAAVYYNPLTFRTRQLTGNTLSTTAEEGYIGFSNYAVTRDGVSGLGNILDGLSPAEVLSIASNPDAFIASLQLQQVNGAFPSLNANQGFTLEFDLAISEEVSATGRAGFSALIVTEDLQGIELGFKENGASDYVFAQNAGLTSLGEDSQGVPLDLGATNTYQLVVENSTYQLLVNGSELLTGAMRDYDFDPTQSDPPFPETFNPYETPSLVFLGDNTDQGYADFVLGDIEVITNEPETLTPDKYDDYIASYSDLIEAFGYNPAAAPIHYETAGIAEGRQVDRFDEVLYMASNPDLILAFGSDFEAATRHYIEHGYREGRPTDTFIPELYLEAYGDLAAAFGDDTEAATRHYVQAGYLEGRDFLLGFDPAAYIASYQDLIDALGYDPEAGLQHYLTNGYDEGRTVTFEADDYIASYGDLIGAFGYDLDGGTEHYIRFGASEGRAKDDFDELAYLNNYGDLQTAFGSDLTAATRHYILNGFAEGRTDGELAVA